MTIETERLRAKIHRLLQFNLYQINRVCIKEKLSTFYFFVPQSYISSNNQTFCAYNFLWFQKTKTVKALEKIQKIGQGSVIRVQGPVFLPLTTDS